MAATPPGCATASAVPSGKAPDRLLLPWVSASMFATMPAPRLCSGCANLQLSWYLHQPLFFQWQHTVAHFSVCPFRGAAASGGLAAAQPCGTAAHASVVATPTMPALVTLTVQGKLLLQATCGPEHGNFPAPRHPATTLKSKTMRLALGSKDVPMTLICTSSGRPPGIVRRLHTAASGISTKI